MAVWSLLCLCLVLSCVIATAVEDQNGSAHRLDRAKFREWMHKYNKKYLPEEYEGRFANFRRHLEEIKLAKQYSPKANFDLNKFADLSKEEFARRLSHKKYTGEELNRSCLANGITAVRQDTSSLPTSWDWRTKGVVTPVKDQGQCGSCWAFSTIGNIESQWALHGKKLIQFSEQMLVDCSHGCANEPPYGNVCNQGCDGGWQWNAFGDVMTWGGVMLETAYPYTAVTGSCHMNKTGLYGHIKNYTCLSTPSSSKGADENQMAAFLISNGPISIALDASYLESYSDGIIDPWFGWECDATQLDHALLIVGYGVENSEIWGVTPYWIVKNSWGADWGENGYFRIVRGSGACGLNNAVSSALM